MKVSFPIPSKGTFFTYVVTLLFIGVYVAGISYVHHLRSAVQQSATDLALETAREESLQNLSGFLGEVSGDATTLSTFFVAPDKAVSVIEEVESLGDSLGTKVSISNVQINDKNSTTGEGTMIMNVSAEGSWHTMETLMTLLDTFPSVSRIDMVTLSRGDAATKDAPAQWQLRATMRVWLRK